ncbi:hypothetical protein [Cupriavidus nantongensis]|uniref:Uncharacterized protein n=1 Tax=Cupriavidus nantongensis TaxID=1796606 RepID=A0A142JIM9_9BURK|nr:hypothetical protein [Cupriavidus nantongensis]AMR77941.1 hypothetical protein A2G96_09420 [Cupriavidus nantongensis]
MNENFMQEVRYHVAVAKAHMRNLRRFKARIAEGEATRTYVATDFLDCRAARAKIRHHMMQARKWKHLAFGGRMTGTKHAPNLPKKLAYGTKLHRAYA